MNESFKLKKSIRLVTATLAGSITMAGAVSAENSIFSIQELPTGYMVADSHMEGKCGESMKDADGESMKDADGESMKDADGESMKDADGESMEGC